MGCDSICDPGYTIADIHGRMDLVRLGLYRRQPGNIGLVAGAAGSRTHLGWFQLPFRRRISTNPTRRLGDPGDLPSPSQSLKGGSNRFLPIETLTGVALCVEDYPVTSILTGEETGAVWKSVYFTRGSSLVSLNANVMSKEGRHTYDISVNHDKGVEPCDG